MGLFMIPRGSFPGRHASTKIVLQLQEKIELRKINLVPRMGCQTMRP